MNLPNTITMLRMLLILVVAWLLHIGKNEWAAALFILLAASDMIDGYLARKKGQITDFGKVMDPLADKMLVVAALIFLIGDVVKAWMVFVIVAREFSVMGLRVMAASKGYVIAAKVSGKIKTISQLVAVVFVMLALPYAYYMMVLAVLITVYSGVEYLWVERKLFT